MKNKITLTIILTSLFVLLTGALTAHAACTGHLDGVSGDTISGWAWDPEDPQKEVSVTLTIKNAADSAVVRSLTVNACESFSHLADAGIGTGNYGFSANAALSALTLALLCGAKRAFLFVSCAERSKFLLSS